MSEVKINNQVEQETTKTDSAGRYLERNPNQERGIQQSGVVNIVTYTKDKDTGVINLDIKYPDLLTAEQKKSLESIVNKFQEHKSAVEHLNSVIKNTVKNTNDLIKEFNELCDLGEQVKQAGNNQEARDQAIQKYNQQLDRVLQLLGVPEDKVNELKNDPSKLRAAVSELRNRTEEALKSAQARVKQTSEELEKIVQENGQKLQARRVEFDYYDKVHSKAREVGAQPFVYTIADERFNTARLNYFNAFSSVASQVDQDLFNKLNKDQRLAVLYGTVLDVTAENNKLAVAGIDKFYLDLAGKNTPSTAKALDPLVAKAFNGFVKYGVCDSNGRSYSDSELMRLWGFNSQEEFNYARRHLFGSINKDYFYRKRFAGIDSLQNRPDKDEIISNLLSGGHRLLNDRTDRENKLGKVLTYTLFRSAVAFASGASGEEVLESAGVAALSSYIGESLPKEFRPYLVGLLPILEHAIKMSISHERTRGARGPSQKPKDQGSDQNKPPATNISPPPGTGQTGTGNGSQVSTPPGTAQNGTNNGPKIDTALNSGPDDATISPPRGGDQQSPAPGLPRGENP